MASMEARGQKTQHSLKADKEVAHHAKFHENRTSGSCVFVSVVQKTGLLHPPLVGSKN